MGMSDVMGVEGGVTRRLFDIRVEVDRRKVASFSAFCIVASEVLKLSPANDTSGQSSQ